MTEFERLITERTILVCCGSGGVGKTTTAAAVGLAGATLGRRCCVVTIDPARRLADTLDVDGLSNVPHKIEGAFSGELDAVMLDAAGTFDELVRRYAKDPDQTKRILENRVYRNLATALSGTQEYMATEKLYELHEQGGYDLIVVDTPPTRSALDFLDAPGRIAGFLDNRIFRLLLMPGHGYLRAMNVASQVLLRTIARVAGSEIVEDAIAFFQAFEGMEEGFKERAARVQELLASDSTAFVLVAVPRHYAIEEATYFAERLAAGGHQIGALVVNRVYPDFGEPLDAPSRLDGTAYGQLVANLAELGKVAHIEAAWLADLLERVEPAPSVKVPFFDTEVNDLDGLRLVARHLVGRELP